MKTTLEVPDSVFRQAKARAAEEGLSLRDFVTEALQEKLAGRGGRRAPRDPDWMRGFGKLRALKKETSRIQSRIDREFGVIESEDRA